MRSYNFCVLGSALVIYNDIKNKCTLAIFLNSLIANILDLQNSPILQHGAEGTYDKSEAVMVQFYIRYSFIYGTVLYTVQFYIRYSFIYGIVGTDIDDREINTYD